MRERRGREGGRERESGTVVWDYEEGKGGVEEEKWQIWWGKLNEIRLYCYMQRARLGLLRLILHQTIKKEFK